MPIGFSPTALAATLSIQIADQIGVAILEEELAPGERIREANLAETFGVSRATVRDALRILETRGLVKILPQRGAKITALSAAELNNLFEIRALLLGLASRHAAEHFVPAHEAELRAAFESLNQACTQDANAYARASAAMVVLITQLSENAQLAELILGFASRIGRYARMGLLTPARRRRSLANWKTLVSAIRAGNGDLAEKTHRRLALENRDEAITVIRARELEQQKAAEDPDQAPSEKQAAAKRRGGLPR